MCTEGESIDMRSLWIGAAALCLAGSCVAQEVLSDPAPYRRPALFVVPDAPTQLLAEHEERSYFVKVALDSRGRITQVLDVEPDDPEFRARLNEVVRLWVFYPSVDPGTCMPAGSDAAVRLQYRRAEKEPRVWLEYDPVGSVRLQPRSLRILHQPPEPLYPRTELMKGLQSDVLVIGAFAPDGTAEYASIEMALPPSPGFEKVALEHFRGIVVDAGTAPRRCVLIHYVFRLN